MNCYAIYATTYRAVCNYTMYESQCYFYYSEIGGVHRQMLGGCKLREAQIYILKHLKLDV